MISTLNVKEFTAEDILNAIHNQGYLLGKDDNIVRCNWVEYIQDYHQHVFLVMFDDLNNDAGRFFLTELFVFLNEAGKIAADFPGTGQLGAFHKQSRANTFYNTCLRNYKLPRAQRHKHIPLK